MDKDAKKSNLTCVWNLPNPWPGWSYSTSGFINYIYWIAQDYAGCKIVQEVVLLLGPVENANEFPIPKRIPPSFSNAHLNFVGFLAKFHGVRNRDSAWVVVKLIQMYIKPLVVIWRRRSSRRRKIEWRKAEFNSQYNNDNYYNSYCRLFIKCYSIEHV